MGKTHVGIIFGGHSVEHEVSLQSAKNIVDSLDRDHFEVLLLGIDKQGKWYLNDTSNYLLHEENPELIALRKSHKEVALLPGHQYGSFIQANKPEVLKIDVIFPIMHGSTGEDGSLQGLLRMANLPFVGSSVLGSALSMDKDIAKRLLRDSGLSVTPSVTLTRNHLRMSGTYFEKITILLGLPLFIKPANQGSSVGISKVTDYESFYKAISLAFNFDNKVIVESAIIGREIECAILGNEYPQASVCGEIVLKENFYTYQTKYMNNSSARLVVPAEISDEISEKIRRIALQAFQTLNCAGMARVDVFLTSDNQVLVNEVNTSPGFTSISMYPKLWQASGLSYTVLINKLIELALERYRQDQNLISSLPSATTY